MIAQGFDRPDSPRVLSMAHAFSRSSDFVLGGFFDTRAGRAEAAEGKWGVPPSPRSRDAWLDERWDVVYVATPDTQHGADLRDALQRRPRGVLMEKPLASDGAEALELLAHARELGVVVMADYPRRWHSGIARLRASVDAGALSPPDSAFIAVSGGALHNLPHTIDLMHSLWGGGWTVERVSCLGELTHLRWCRGSCTFPMAVLERTSSHYLWEAHFYCAQGKVELSHSPEVLEWACPAPHPDYHGYNVLTPVFRVDMEGEPLLGRVLDALAGSLRDPSAGARALEREIDSQQLAAAALRWF